MKRESLLVIVGVVAGLIVTGSVRPASADTRARELVRMEVDGDPEVPTGTVRGPAQGKLRESDDLCGPRARVVRERRASGWRLQLWHVVRTMTWIRRSLS